MLAQSGAANYTSAVRKWYNEVQFYNYSSNSCNYICEHFTQVRTVIISCNSNLKVAGQAEPAFAGPIFHLFLSPSVLLWLAKEHQPS